MKTLKNQIIRKLSAGALSMIILIGSTGLLAAKSKDPVKKQSKVEQEAIESVEKAFKFNTDLPDEEFKNYKVYDAEDNLIHEVSLNTKLGNKDKKLIKYLLVADFVMEYGDTKYYRINS